MQRTLRPLKIIPFIPPLLALAVIGIWNVRQTQAVHVMEQDNREMRRILREEEGRLVSAPKSSKLGKISAATMSAAIAWKDVAGKISATAPGGEAEKLRAVMDLQQRLKLMTRDELIAALDEIDLLELSPAERAEMVSMIVAELAKKDTPYALDRFVDQIEADPDGIGWQLGDAFGEWAKNDPAAATAWFDRQIAAGKFESRSLDGRSEMRAMFEAGILPELLTSDLAAAGRRLLALPEDQRREVLEQLPFTDLAPNARKDYAALVRQLVPADERPGSFANIATQLVENGGDYQKVSDFLDAVQATPDERAVSARQAAASQLEVLGEDGEINASTVDALRTWLDVQAPGQSNTITGKALAEAAQDGGDFNYDQAAELVLRYQQSTGNDAVLVAFLQGYSAHSNLEEAQALINKISDPQLRQPFLDELK
ncbi:MAG: hypothetical protein V4640_08840 [Verrucomicrobiota bacterium]